MNNMNLYQEFIALSKFARWLPEQNRRETWNETVSRYVNFLTKHLKENFNIDIDSRIEKAILNFDILPSMRMLLTAGEAAEKDNASIYNCSAVPLDSVEAFSEALYLLMCGVGVGFSVEQKFITKLPKIPSLYNSEKIIIVEDTRVGWATALHELLSSLFSGEIPLVDYTEIRPKGTPLKVFGGMASGPEILIDLFNFIICRFESKSGKFLNSLDCLDITCKIAGVVVDGGVRRAALICLGSKNDKLLAKAKKGEWWQYAPHRRFANISLVFERTPSKEDFNTYWQDLRNSQSGEPGFFNRKAAIRKIVKKLASYGISERLPNLENRLINPCAEAFVSNNFCNLATFICRQEDTEESIKEKIELATMLSTYQATFTNFRFLRPIWKERTEAECLCGVSPNGIQDSPVMYNASPYFLDELKWIARTTNKVLSKKLNIKESRLITLLKPCGNSSQLCDCSPGIRYAHAEYWIRSVEMSKSDSLTEFMLKNNFPYQELKGEKGTILFQFPQKAKDIDRIRENFKALDLLEIVQRYNTHFADHNVSCTIDIKNHEWDEVRDYVYENIRDTISLAFMPFFEEDSSYEYLPYKTCTEKEYNDLLAKMPRQINWNDLLERSDKTNNNTDLACKGAICSI